MIIAIDGTAGSGKSTISKKIAEHYSFRYLNSGAFYRAVTYVAILRGDIISGGGIHESNNNQYIESVIDHIVWNSPYIALDLSKSNHFSSLKTLVLDQELYTVSVDKQVAKVSQSTPLRIAINNKIRGICKSYSSWIIEGRDVGTHIFPDAECKVYLDADLEARTSRRLADYKKNKKQSKHIDATGVSKIIHDRDNIDKNKGKYSLTILDNTHYIDTSDLTIAQVLEKMYNIINTISHKEIEK